MRLCADENFPGDAVHEQGGIILCRLRGLSPSQLTDTLLRAIESRDDWVGLFAVILNDRIRVVPLPSA
jgi:hypothetical protein